MPLNMNGTKSERAEVTEKFIHKLKCKFGKINIETTHTSYCIYNASSGIVEFTGGKIVNNKGLTGGGIYNGIGTIIMNGGTMYPVMLGIENEKTGIVEINGGEIVSINNIGAVRNRSTGKVTINSGVLRTLQSIVINDIALFYTDEERKSAYTCMLELEKRLVENKIPVSITKKRFSEPKTTTVEPYGDLSKQNSIMFTIPENILRYGPFSLCDSIILIIQKKQSHDTKCKS